MKILLTGSSGFIGRHVSSALMAEGHDVLGVNRAAGCDFNQMLKVNDWVPYLQSIDAVINCVGIIAETPKQSFERLHELAPSALFRACEQTGVKRIVQVSALGADEQAFTPYQLSKKAADDVLRLMCCDWFILRPSLVYGEESRSTRFFKGLAKYSVLPLVEGGWQQVQPVHIDDLVSTVQACLIAQKTKQTIDVVGPRAISIADWIQVLRKQLGKTRAFVFPVPFKLMLSASHLVHRMIPLLHPDNLRMLQQGNVASNEAMIRLIGRPPRELS